MVALDRSEMDKVILSQLNYLADNFKPDSIIFIHVHKFRKGHELLSFETKPIRGQSFCELLKNELSESVAMFFSEANKYHIEYLVTEEKSVNEGLYKQIIAQHADLLIVGNKYQKGNGINAKNICRNSKCNILFIPETGVNNIQNILNPVDFSSFSKVATQFSLNLSNYTNSNVTALYIYDLPDFGKNEAYNKIYEPKIINAATDAYNRYIAQVELECGTIKPQFERNHNYEGAEIAVRIAESQNIDLIVISSHGKSAFNRFLIGSFTEKIIDVNKNIPLMIVKCCTCFDVHTKMKNKKVLAEIA